MDVIIKNPKHVNFVKLHIEMLAHAGSIELTSNELLLKDVVDETTVMQIYELHDPDTPFPRQIGITPNYQIILADGINSAKVTISGDANAIVDYTVNNEPFQTTLDALGQDEIELTSDTPNTTIVVEAGTARAVIYAVEVPS